MRALVLSGGGSMGSFQVGVLKHFSELNIKYNMYYGISVGAINCACLAMFDSIQEGYSKLYEFWTKINDKNIKKCWFPFGIIQGWKELGLYNSEPLCDLIKSNFDRNKVIKSGNKLGVGTVSVIDGSYNVFTENDENICDAIINSAITPIVLCPLRTNNDLFLDGGLRHIVPIQDAINAGATEIDVIVVEPENKTDIFYPKNLLDLGQRILGIMVLQMTNNDIELAIYKNPNISIRVIRPLSQLNGASTDFSSTNISKNIDLGYNIAKNITK